MTSESPRDFSRKPASEREPNIDWGAIEAVTHCDPAGRGLASYRREGRPLDAGQLRAAAVELASRARTVGIVTGFCVRDGELVTAETDGPPGTLFLARALDSLGLRVVLVTDRYARPALEVGRDHWRLENGTLVEMPCLNSEESADGEAAKHWATEFFFRPAARDLSHLIAIERPGPSHTLTSLAAQERTGASPSQRFAAEVPAADQDVCHNMRGVAIDRWTAPTQVLFDRGCVLPNTVTTIGIGDGGNEIGMGSYAWETLVEAIPQGPAARIASRVATDFAPIAGVSNWGAYALALAVLALRGEKSLARELTVENEARLVERIVGETSTVDGLTGRREPTVDGLPLDVYLQPLAELRRLLGFDAG